MAFFAVPNMVDAPETEVLEENTEVEVKCIAVEDKVGKESGNPYINLTLEPISHPNAKLIYHMIFPPTGQEDSPRKVNDKISRLRNICGAFGVPFSNEGFDPDNFTGQTAVGIAKKEEDQNGGYRNAIKQWVTQQ